LTLTPIDTSLNVDKSILEYIKRRLVKQKSILTSGQEFDVKIFPFPPSYIHFKVLKVKPEGNVKVSTRTVVQILEEPLNTS
jgi:hypothetical protein